MIKNINFPAPQPEDHARNEDPGFHEDPNIFVEFEDVVYYQAILDGSDVAIMADYPDLYPFVKVSIQISYSSREIYTFTHILPSILGCIP